MIEKIQQSVDFKLIKDSAYKTINLLRKNPNFKKVDSVYKQYLSEGKKAPGYAKTIMKLAQNDASSNDIKQMLDNKISHNKFEKYFNHIRNTFHNVSINNSKAESELEKAGKEIYPRTWDLRSNILNWWRDNSEHRYKTSQFKNLKRDFWGTMGEINPKIKEMQEKYK